MIIIDNDINTIDFKDEIKNIFEPERKIIEQSVMSQKSLKTIVLQNLNSFVDLTGHVDSENEQKIYEFLEKIKASLDLCNNNIDYLKELEETLDRIIMYSENNYYNIDVSIQSFNLKSYLLNIEINENIRKINECLKEISEESCLKILENIALVNSTTTTPIQEEINQYENIVENTLIISQIKQKVVLPYTKELLEKTLENNPNDYSTVYDIINKKYTIPISKYKNSYIARFKEAFVLMRKREFSSILDSFSLATEVSFNKLLNPAIITACKNLDELDIYLDCLASNELNKFPFFDIQYEVLPVKKFSFFSWKGRRVPIT